MPAGFQSFVEGSLIGQLDNTMTYFRLVGSGTIPSSGWQNPQTPISGIGNGNPTFNFRLRYFSIPQISGSINPAIAFHTPAGFASLEVTGSGEIYVQATENAISSGIQWFAFDTSEPPAVNQGIELYVPPTQRVSYNAQMKPMRPLGIMSRVSSNGQWSPPPNIQGKKLAGIVVKLGVSWAEYGEDQGGYWYGTGSNTTTGFHVSLGAPTTQNLVVSDAYTSGGSGLPFRDVYGGSSGDIMLIIDVTGY